MVRSNGTKTNRMKLVRELRGGEPYEYYPLGRYIVAAPGVCGGRPTFKYTRIRVEFVLDLIAAGWSLDEITYKFRTSHLAAAAVREAISLAKKAFIKTTEPLRVAA